MKNQVDMPKKIRFKLVAPLLVCLFCAAYVFYAGFLPYMIIPTNTQLANAQSTPAFTLYFISLNKSKLESSAASLSADFQKIGAGGYIWKHDDFFHVIASCYEKENDAVLVQNNIKVNFNLESQIFSVNFPSLVLGEEIENEKKKVLSKALKSFYTTYQSLFDIAISLDTNVYNEISARLAVNTCFSNFSATFADFQTLFKDNEEDYLLLSSCLKKGNEILQVLCSARMVNNGQTYSSLIKYRYLQFLSAYYDFLNKF